MLSYRSIENAEASVRHFCRLKKQCSKPMSERALRGMMIKSEKTGQLGVLPGSGEIEFTPPSLVEPHLQGSLSSGVLISVTLYFT
ncbi:hypothetical protein TNCV_4181901 [Trichonephila clavipes]|nr:hypothetical protein TNCV_4181901 [Trichonephila clavipes]